MNLGLHLGLGRRGASGPSTGPTIDTAGSLSPATFKIGTEETITAGTASASGGGAVTYEYRWLVTGISDASTAAYTPLSVDHGESIAAQWRAVETGGTNDGETAWQSVGSGTISTNDLLFTFSGTGITVPMRTAGTYSATMTVDDGAGDAITTFNDADLVISGLSAGTHTVRFSGQLGGLYFSSNATEASKVLEVQNAGNLSYNEAAGFMGNSTSITKITFGTTDLDAVTSFAFAMFDNSALTEIDFTGADFTNVTNFGSAFKNNANLGTLTGHAAAFATAAPQYMDEIFRNNTAMSGYALDLSGMSIANLIGTGTPTAPTGGAFDMVAPGLSLDTDAVEATLIAWSTEATDFGLTGDPTPIGFGSTPITGAAAQAAIVNLEGRGYWITSGYNAVPDTPDAPTATDLAGAFQVDFPATPFGYGRPVTAWDVRHSNDGGSNWTVVTDHTDGGSISVAADTYLVQVRAKNTDGASAWSASDSVTVTSATFGAEVIGEEPTISVDNTNPNSLTFTITGTTNRDGTYSQNKADGDAPITASSLEIAPACLALHTISGTPAAGNVLTVQPALWVYEGPDQGDPVLSLVNDTDGALELNELSYRCQTTDVGDTLTFTETYLGETVSVTTVAVATGDATAPTFDAAGSTPADGATGQSTTIDLVMQLSEDIALGTGDIVIYNLTDSVVRETISVADDFALISISGSQLTINTLSDLPVDKSFSVRWDAGIVTDLAGNPLAANTTDTLWNFDTIAGADVLFGGDATTAYPDNVFGGDATTSYTDIIDGGDAVSAG